MSAPNELDLAEVRRALRPRLVLGRALRAARLEPALYEEVEADRESVWQAGAIVIAAWIATAIYQLRTGAEATTADFAAGAFSAIVAWGGYAAAVWLLGTTFLRGRETSADIGEVMRTLGFASAPLVLLAVIPVAFAGLAFLWQLLATVVAVRAALDIGTLRAVIVAALGTALYAYLEATIGGIATALV